MSYSYLDTIPVAISMFDKTKKIIYRNHLMEEVIFLHDLDEHGENFLAHIAGSGSGDSELAPKAEAIFDTGISNPEPFSAEIALMGYNGGSNFSLTLQRIELENNDVCAVLLLNDVTMLTRAKIDALAASRAKTDFLARMSHEIRTPMNAVLGMVQIAKDSEEIDKIMGCIEQIESSSNDLLGIIDDILNFNKIESGKIQLDLCDFSLTSNINKIISMMTSKAKQKNIEIELIIEKIENDAVKADSHKLDQVLISLISNAIKFSKDKGKIIIKIRELGYMNGNSTFLYEVIDNGIGISEFQASKLFRPFEQADGGITRKYGGIGLGLSISKNYVEMMGGKISLQSKEGEGSVFSFTINCAAKPEITPETTEITDDKLVDFSGKRCLIVDDIEINREIVMELLSETNIIQETAENGQEALELFKTGGPGKYDIIFMDMQMPVMDGLTAAREIRLIEKEWSRESSLEQVPIIAMTANVLDEDIQNAYESGMNTHLGKPIDRDKTIKTMRDFFIP